MNSLRKCISFALILAVVTSSLFFCESTIAASKPSTPQVTVKFVDAKYPAPSTDPYTGQTSTILEGNYSIEVTIQNQAASDPNSQIYYNIRVKPHFEKDSWAELYGVRYYISENNGDGTFDYAYFINEVAPAQSTSSTTTITIPLEEGTIYGKTGIYYHIPSYSNYTSDVPEGGQVDFQVQALVGHATQRWVSRSPFATTVGGYDVDAVAFDAASDWSSTQTVKIGDGSDSASPSENGATPTHSEDANPQQTADSIPLTTFAIVVVALVAAIAALTAMLLRRQRK